MCPGGTGSLTWTVSLPASVERAHYIAANGFLFLSRWKKLPTCYDYCLWACVCLLACVIAWCLRAWSFATCHTECIHVYTPLSLYLLSFPPLSHSLTLSHTYFQGSGGSVRQTSWSYPCHPHGNSSSHYWQQVSFVGSFAHLNSIKYVWHGAKWTKKTIKLCTYVWSVKI